MNRKTLMKAWLSVLALCSMVQKANGLEGLAGVGGTFMYGHINWDSQEGNVVNFLVETSYRREILTDFWKDGNAQVGDVLLLSDVGIGTTIFYFGDGMFSDDLRLRVTAYSAQENWVLGDFVLTHEYPSPSNNGLPWIASLSGCCRMESLTNQKDSDYDIKSYVNLLESRHSPVARMIPLVTSYIHTTGAQMSNVFINADDPMGTDEIEWSVSLPWDVGNAANFSSSKFSFASVSLNNLNSPLDACYSEECRCDAVTPGQTTGFGIGPSCLFNLLRTNSSEGSNELTLEGWVKARSAGYVVTTGPDRCYYDASGAKQCPAFQPPGFCSGLNALACSTSTLFVEVNDTHILVGHETPTTGVSTATVVLAFSCSSNIQVCSSSAGGLLNQWIHVAVVRKMTTVTGMVTYKVYVNAELLEASTYPAGDRSNGQTAGESYLYSLGESVQVYGPRNNNMDNLDFAIGTALIFGAKINAGNFYESSFLDGELDEWRFWHGERSQVELELLMQRNLIPSISTIYGAPDLYDRTSRILACYSFDETPPLVQTDACTLQGQIPCPLYLMYPTFPTPDDPRATALGTFNSRRLYEAVANDVLSSPAGIYYTQAAASITNGLLTLLAPSPGYYQVTVSASLAGGRATVPIDLIVSVVRASWVLSPTSCPLLMPPLSNQLYMTSLDPNRYVPSLTITARVSDATNAATGQCSLSAVCMAKYTGSRGKVKTLGDGAELLLAPYCRIQAVAGSEVDLTVASMDADPASNVGFTVSSVPATVRMTTVALEGPSKWGMNVSWWPCLIDVGNHTMCFEAVDTLPAANASGPSGPATVGAKSPPQCLRLEIVPPSPPQLLFYASDGTYTEGSLVPVTSVNTTMGVETYLLIAAQTDNCVEALAIERVMTPDGPSMPEGMQLVPLGAAGAVLAGTCPKVQDQSPCTCPIDRVGVRWTPGLKYGGMSRLVCFQAREAMSHAADMCPGMAPQQARSCIMMTVQRCKFALGMDQELQEVASAFRIDWMRLWSLNPDLLHPDYILFADQVLSVGHLFRAVGGETPGALAERMGMDLSLLQMLNNDIDTSLPLSPGQVLCVVPNSCGGTAATVYSSIEYKEPSFFAAEVADTMPIPGQLAAQIFEAYPPT